MNPKDEPAYQPLQACESFSQRDKDMITLGLIYHSVSLIRRQYTCLNGGGRFEHLMKDWEIKEVETLEKLEKTYNFKIQ